MRRILTGFIVLYWTAFFGLLAGISTLDPQRGMLTAFDVIGVGTEAAYLPAATVSALFSLVFALAAVVFLWALVAIVLGGSGEEVELTALAFGGGAGALSVMLTIGLLIPTEEPARALAFQMAAMTASYLVILQVERRLRPALSRPVLETVIRPPSPVRIVPFTVVPRPDKDTGELR